MKELSGADCKFNSWFQLPCDMRYSQMCAKGSSLAHDTTWGSNCDASFRLKSAFALKCQGSSGFLQCRSCSRCECPTSSQTFIFIHLFHLIPICWKTWHSRQVLKIYKINKAYAYLRWKAVILISFFFFWVPSTRFSHCAMGFLAMFESQPDEMRQPGDGFLSRLNFFRLSKPTFELLFCKPMSVRDGTDNSSQGVPLSPM